jgi:hypothetical protein
MSARVRRLVACSARFVASALRAQGEATSGQCLQGMYLGTPLLTCPPSSLAGGMTAAFVP